MICISRGKYTTSLNLSSRNFFKSTSHGSSEHVTIRHSGPWVLCISKVIWKGRDWCGQKETPHTLTHKKRRTGWSRLRKLCKTKEFSKEVKLICWLRYLHWFGNPFKTPPARNSDFIFHFWWEDVKVIVISIVNSSRKQWVLDAYNLSYTKLKE